ncbi:xaa-Arg dipeptidase-like [Oppia nitens]|uniref:xaa-Arg dipeptidase-like n=1 Tax=Oppia nitens TaxID=1686743 RepID=UPI0023DBCCFA|nr:xaa-Arg dipeptidase-like [Oppia nitens]
MTKTIDVKSEPKELTENKQNNMKTETKTTKGKSKENLDNDDKTKRNNDNNNNNTTDQTLIDSKKKPLSQDIKSDAKTTTTNDTKNTDQTSDVQKHYNRDVWFVTSSSAKAKIASRTKQLEKISAEILANPDVAHEEKEIHRYLCGLLAKLDCTVHSSYIHPTAFKAEFKPNSKTNVTVGLICEYDAVKGFGHSKGNNLSTEATIATFLGIREAMKADSRLLGTVIILGTPASEESSGKIRMLKEGAFNDMDALFAVHPSNYDSLCPKFYCSQKIRVNFFGISRHIDCLNVSPGENACEASVLCYTNALALSAQVQPRCQIHCIIKRCGDVDYLVPKKTELVFSVRAPTLHELDSINKRIVDCGEAAALATRTRVEFHFPDDDMHCSVNHNSVLAKVFKDEAKKLGITFKTNTTTAANNNDNDSDIIYRTTDLGNVSHKVPLIYPAFAIGCPEAADTYVHSRQFSTAVAKVDAQKYTIKAATALAMTVIRYLLDDSIRQNAKKLFDSDFQALNKCLIKTVEQKVVNNTDKKNEK